jgi:hypothetical protein
MLSKSQAAYDLLNTCNAANTLVSSACQHLVPWLQVTSNAWFTQLRYISAIYFTLEGLMVNELQGSTIDCSAGLDTGLASLVESALVNASGFQQTVLLQLTQPQEG